jgi:hypothetical protein
VTVQKALRKKEQDGDRLGGALGLLRGKHWPTPLTLDEFQRATGETDFPDHLKPRLKDGRFDYFCNKAVDYTLRDLHVRLRTFPRQPRACGSPERRGGTVSARSLRRAECRLRSRVGACRAYAARRHDANGLAGPGVRGTSRAFSSLDSRALSRWSRRALAMVARRFLDYVRNPEALPAWEKANMLAKYYVTTMGVELGRRDRLH